MSARTTRRLLLATAVGAGALLQLGGFATHPELGDTPTQTLAVVAADPGRWVLTHLLAASAAALSVVAAVALAGLVRARGAALATVGATLSVLGGICLTMAFGAEAHLLPLAADASLDAAAMAELAELEETGLLVTVLLLGFPLSGLGSLLLMCGLLRSRAVPAWKPALVIVGLVASFAAGPGDAIGAFLLAPAALGTLALAVEVARGGRVEPEAEAAQERVTAVSV